MAKPLVLIVEDNLETRLMLQWFLESEGFQVVSAPDAAAASQVLTQVRPNVIITDWAMPGRNGAELIREVRRTNASPPIPIFVFTAYAEGHQTEAEEAGATAVLRKPEDLLRLPEFICQALKSAEDTASS